MKLCKIEWEYSTNGKDILWEHQTYIDESYGNLFITFYNDNDIKYTYINKKLGLFTSVVINAITNRQRLRI